MGVDLVDGAVCVLHPLAVGVADKLAGCIKGGSRVTVFQQGLGQVDQFDSILGQLFGSLTAHGVDGDINGSAESSALCGVNNFIHRHNKTLSFSKRYTSHCSASKAYPAAAGPFG